MVSFLYVAIFDNNKIETQTNLFYQIIVTYNVQAIYPPERQNICFIAILLQQSSHINYNNHQKYQIRDENCVA